MECVINRSKEINSTAISKSNDDFRRELAQGHFNALIHEKQRELNQYLKAYNDLTDKSSFNADYIDSLIYLFKVEIKELQKLF